MSEMKLCPFCGSEAITTTFIDPDDFEYMPIEVNDCDAEVTCKNERCINGWWLSPKAWNNRPIEDELQARIAELEAERRWRVVADGEFPELGEEVIFYDSIMERRLKGCLRKNGGVEWLSDEGYTFSSRDGRYSWITHWMPLPESPNDTQKDTVVYGKERER